MELHGGVLALQAEVACGGSSGRAYSVFRGDGTREVRGVVW